MYETNPLAFLVEQAGGAASDGIQRTLEIHPNSLHQRTPFFVGSPEDVRIVQEFLAGRR
jgi:fructose-1,6-bisphosphatase I